MSKPPSHHGAPTRASEELLRSARGDHAPSSADRERVRRALATRLAESADTLPDASASPTRGLLHPLAKTGIGLVLLAAGITTLMHTNDQPKSVAVKTPVALPAVHQASEAQRGEPTRSTQQPPTVAGDVFEPSAPARERPAASVKRAAPRSKAALRTGARQESRAPAATSVSTKPVQRIESDADTTPATSLDSPIEHTARAANSSPVAVNMQAQVRESKVSTASADIERKQRPDSPAARAHDAAPDGREELVFLARIRAELSESEYEDVLELCEEHKRRWPHGTFAQEREGLRAIALCETEHSKAADNARAFFASYPHSPMAPRVRAACAPQPKAATPRSSR